LSPISPSWRRIAVPAGSALAGTIAVLAAMVGPPWFRVLVPMSAQLRWQIAFLKVARSGYVAVVMVLPATLALLAIAAAVARRRRVRAPRLARALALGPALAFGMSVAEGVSAARLAAMRMPFPRLTTGFPDPPGDRTVDVVVLGESSAVGAPYQDWLSVGKIVAWKLGDALWIKAGTAPEDVGLPGVGTRSAPRANMALTSQP
jgi:hypothetical protein